MSTTPSPTPTIPPESAADPGQGHTSAGPGHSSRHPARGKIIGRRDGLLRFKPRGTAYELHLAGDFDGPLDKFVEGQIVVQARKAYTVASGGNFIAPITGTPRIVQGRVLEVLPDTGHARRRIVIQAGATVVVDLPPDSHAIDLGNGVIETGALVNVVALPGTTFEPA